MRTIWDPKSPSLLPAIVFYADILGFRGMTERAYESGKAEEFLQRVKGSLATAYDAVRNVATLRGCLTSAFDMKVFTDNIVVAYPLGDPSSDSGEPELGTLITLFAQVQASLAKDGFFLRGAIASGDHYQDDDIAYGMALLEAVDLDKSGGPPRLVVGSSVEPLIAKQISFYGNSGQAWHHEELLEDPRDEYLFINYLQVAFDFFPDGPINQELLEAHCNHLQKRLKTYKSEVGVREKYEWLATYHNYVCRAFADLYSVQHYEGTDPEVIAVREEAQLSLKYLVPSEAFTPMQSPRPLDTQRLKHRLTET